MTEMIYKQLVSFGLDKHGFYGLIYSADNGANYKLLVGTQGRIFYPEDAQNFWPYLQGFVSKQIASAVSLTWDNIKGKPNLVLRSDLPDFNQFALKKDLPAPVDLSGYAKTDAVEAAKATAESALNSAEKAQSTAEANSKVLANKADRSELPVVPTDLVHNAELEQVKETANQATQTASEAVTLAKSANVTIDTSSIHQIKKPSEYSEGFSYEVKALSDLGIDLTKYDTSVQNGWIGLVKSVQVSMFSTVYVTQTVRVLGSYRPTTFIRNGSGDSWYPFELVTTW